MPGFIFPDNIVWIEKAELVRVTSRFLVAPKGNNFAASFDLQKLQVELDNA